MKLQGIRFRKKTIILLIFLFATISTPVYLNIPLSPVSASYNVPLLHQYTIYQWSNTFTAQQYSSYTGAFQISYDASSTIINQIHAIEPNFIGLVYRNVIKISKYATSEWTEFTTNNWVLKDATGKLPYETRFGYYFADIGNPDYQQWVANWIYTQIGNKNANGLFADGGLCTYPAEIWEFASTQPINPRTETYWTDQEVRDAYVGLYNAIRAKLGGDKLIVVNGIWSGSRWQSRMSAYMDILSRTSINGIMGEGWWRDFIPSAAWYTESRWKSSLDALVSLENNFVKGSSSRMFISGCFVENGDASLPPGVTANQVARYGYASTLLGVQSNRNYLFLTVNEDRLQDYSNRYFSLDVGTPLGDYSLLSGTHIYQRQFSNALVIVNPTNIPYTISLSGQYKNLDGATVTGLYTVPAYTGEILMTITQNQVYLSVNTVGSGSVVKNPDHTYYDPGTVVSLTATAASGWTFTGWSGDLSGPTNTASITMDSNKAVTATFTTNTQYQLTVLYTGGKGWTNPLPGTYTYNPDEIISITAYNNEGWKFAYWELDGAKVGETNPIAVTMNIDHIIQAMYAPEPTPTPTPVPTPPPTPTPTTEPKPTTQPTPIPTPTPTPEPTSTTDPTPTLQPTPTPPKTNPSSSSTISIIGTIVADS